MLDPGASDPGSSPDRGHCVVFLQPRSQGLFPDPSQGKGPGKEGTSLHPGV